jgi:hypothetical protein
MKTIFPLLILMILSYSNAAYSDGPEPRSTQGWWAGRSCDTSRINSSDLYKRALRMISQKSGKTIYLNSCYRDANKQRRTCRSICGANNCPGRCARNSQHTITVAADFGLPYKPREGCLFLDGIRSELLGGVRGGVGNYGGSYFHFDLDRRKKSWNSVGCTFLKRQPDYYKAAPRPAPEVKREEKINAYKKEHRARIAAQPKRSNESIWTRLFGRRTRNISSTSRGSHPGGKVCENPSRQNAGFCARLELEALFSHD